MFNFNLQLFAHKKGTGSTRNGRDSESKRLGVKCHDGVIVKAGNIIVRQQVKLLSNALVNTTAKLAYTL